MSKTINELNGMLERYAALSRRTPAQIVAKQGKELSMALRSHLLRLAPEKGSVRSTRLAAITAGEGLRVRPAAIKYAREKSVASAVSVATQQPALFVERTKAGNIKKKGRSFWQLAVDRELSFRESGRGYLSLSGRMRIAEGLLASGTTFRSIDRVNRIVGSARMNSNSDGAVLKFSYANPKITTPLEKPRAQAAIDAALKERIADMLLYVNIKLEENKRKAGIS